MSEPVGSDWERTLMLNVLPSPGLFIWTEVSSRKE